MKELERRQHKETEACKEWEEKEESLSNNQDESEGQSSESDEEDSAELVNLQRKVKALSSFHQYIYNISFTVGIQF